MCFNLLVCFVSAGCRGYTQHQFSSAAVQNLQSRGQAAKPGGFPLGISQAIVVDYSSSSSKAGMSGLQQLSSGLLVGQSDSRKDGAPAGY
jgi:hypothetical protein